LNEPSERSLSVWKSTAEPLHFAPLARNVTTEVCVVGAGIEGITTAYLLARAGKRLAPAGEVLNGPAPSPLRPIDGREG